VTHWEYTTYKFEAGDSLVTVLNRFGEGGWEAFHFLPDRRVVFKRPKPEATQEQSK
jgi:hypothetical protein